MNNKYIYNKYAFNSMDTYLLLTVSCCLITTIIRQRKKDIWEIEKYSQVNVYVKIYMYVCVCVD